MSKLQITLHNINKHKGVLLKWGGGGGGMIILLWTVVDKTSLISQQQWNGSLIHREMTLDWLYIHQTKSCLVLYYLFLAFESL